MEKTRFLATFLATREAKKPGFYEDFRLSTRNLGRNPVSGISIFTNQIYLQNYLIVHSN